MLQYFSRSRIPVQVRIVEGREAILAQLALLAHFADRCCQPGGVVWLEYALSTAEALRRHPVLAMVVRAGVGEDALAPGDLFGFAVFHEHKLFGFRTGVASTADALGMRSVVAPCGFHACTAAIAIEALLRRGAHVLLATYSACQSAAADAATALHGQDAFCAQRVREVRRELQIGTTYERTLARLGKATRFGLRYYRKRLARTIGCSFVADARAGLSEGEMLRLNASCLNRVSDDECRLRFRLLAAGDVTFTAGLRASSGQWLSLVSGWRQGRTTIVHWQMNMAGFEKASLVNVMRAYLLQDESERGTRRLMYYDGTTHSMQHSFERDTVCDLIVRRNTLRAWFFRLAASVLEWVQQTTGRSKFMAAALASPDLVWHKCTAMAAPPAPAVQLPAPVDLPPKAHRDKLRAA